MAQLHMDKPSRRLNGDHPRKAPGDFKARTAPPAAHRAQSLKMLGGAHGQAAQRLWAGFAADVGHDIRIAFARRPARAETSTPKPGLLRRLAARVGIALIVFGAGGAGQP
jgi:hypothetical protein